MCMNLAEKLNILDWLKTAQEKDGSHSKMNLMKQGFHWEKHRLSLVDFCHGFRGFKTVTAKALIRHSR